jgi:hypothetical protein
MFAISYYLMYNIKMVELKTTEHLLHFMTKNINLSRFDEKFVESLLSLNQITTNQVELFYKIVYKYRRQFIKHEMDVEKLIYLPWNTKIVESSIQYTAGHVSIEDNTIIFKCPYNKNFVDSFRKIPDNSFKWNKETRQYEASFAPHLLKMLVDTGDKFFKGMFYCHISTELLNSLKEYAHVKYWQPTLCKVNGNLFIVASNSNLDEALGDIVLSSNPTTLAKLVHYGVTIDKSVFEHADAKTLFMANMFCKVELSDALNIIPWLVELKCDYVHMATTNLFAETRKSIKQALTEVNIPFSNDLKFDKRKHEFPVTIRFKSNVDTSTEPFKVGKIIQLVNSQPVEVK